MCLCWLFLILHSVCNLQSPLSSLFLLLLLMHIILPPLHLKFGLTAAERWHTVNQMKGGSVSLHVFTGSCEIVSEERGSMLSATAHCGTVHVQTETLTCPFSDEN